MQVWWKQKSICLSNLRRSFTSYNIIVLYVCKTCYMCVLCTQIYPSIYNKHKHTNTEECCMNAWIALYFLHSAYKYIHIFQIKFWLVFSSSRREATSQQRGMSSRVTVKFVHIESRPHNGDGGNGHSRSPKIWAIKVGKRVARGSIGTINIYTYNDRVDKFVAKYA